MLFVSNFYIRPEGVVCAVQEVLCALIHIYMRNRHDKYTRLKYMSKSILVIVRG